MEIKKEFAMSYQELVGYLLKSTTRQKKNSGNYRPFVKSNHSGKDGK